MRIIVAVHDLIPEKWHLMPWRTAVEVVNNLQKQGHNAMLVSLESCDIELQRFDSPLLPDATLRISKLKHLLGLQLEQAVEMNQTDVIFWPVTWREPRWRTKVVGEHCSHVVGWYPGGVYSLSDSLYALKKLGLKKSLPYLLESFYPKKLQLNYMRDKGISDLLMMTSATARMATANGWEKKNVHVIPPAKDLVKINPGDIGDEARNWLNDSPYLLFMGPPSAIRGVYELLDAFEIAAKKSSALRLVCLFRSDAKLDRDNIGCKIDAMAARGRVFSIWESLSNDQLNAFISACHAAVMPFILVPSEIPLAIIETAAFGKPVLSTQCGGTGEYVANFGASSPVGDVEMLADSMLKMFNDESYYAACCQAASDKYAQHPLWRDVAADWASVAEQVLVKS